MPPAVSADAYVAALDGWRRECVEALRATVRRTAALDEVVKWGHLVYLAGGPVLLIRAKEHRVLFGFWRGQRPGAAGMIRAPTPDAATGTP